MPILASKIRKGQPLTSERRDRDNFLKGKSPTSSQSDLPSSAHCLSPEGQGHREEGVTDPGSPSHVWQAEGEESKPSQFRELSLVQGPHSPVSSGFIPRGVIALTFCRGECGVDGEAINYITTCLLSNRSHFVWWGRERRKTMKRQ